MPGGRLAIMWDRMVASVPFDVAIQKCDLGLPLLFPGAVVT
jgi:hypothetical protein